MRGDLLALQPLRPQLDGRRPDGHGQFALLCCARKSALQSRVDGGGRAVPEGHPRDAEPLRDQWGDVVPHLGDDDVRPLVPGYLAQLVPGYLAQLVEGQVRAGRRELGDGPVEEIGKRRPEGSHRQVVGRRVQLLRRDDDHLVPGRDGRPGQWKHRQQVAVRGEGREERFHGSSVDQICRTGPPKSTMDTAHCFELPSGFRSGFPSQVPSAFDRGDLRVKHLAQIGN